MTIHHSMSPLTYPGDLEERSEEVVEDLLEAADEAVALVDVVEARHLDDPAHVVRVHLVLHRPTRKLVPLVRAATVDREAQLSVLQCTERSHRVKSVNAKTTHYVILLQSIWACTVHQLQNK